MLSAIVESSDDAIVSKTLDGIITSWNHAAERMFGYSAAEAVGRSIRLIIPADRQAEEDYVLERIRRGLKVEHFETVRQTKAGGKLDISLSISPIRDSDGVVIGASKIARDITEQKQLQRERDELLVREQAARSELSDAIRARDELIAVAAHELRNPLHVFALSLQLIHRMVGESAGASQITGIIEKSRNQLRRLTVLINRLMDVAQLQAGKVDLYRERVKLGELVQEVVGRFQVEQPAIPITVEVDSSIDGSWDRLRIDQAVSNLISNALKYGQDRPVVITVCEENGEARVAVKDEGIGICAADLNRIFERFERIARGSADESFGLGLWITKRIAEAHGGTVVAQSSPGKGSVFVLKLPL